MKLLFTPKFVTIIFFHVFLRLKPKATKQTRAIFATLSEKLWNCYQASNKSSFSQQIRRLYEWAIKNNIPPAMLDKIDQVKQNITYIHTTYQHSQAYRDYFWDNLAIASTERPVVSATNSASSPLANILRAVSCFSAKRTFSNFSC